MFVLLLLTINPAALGFKANEGPSDEAKQELEKLQGTWRLVRRTNGGSKEHVDDCQKYKIIIEKDLMTWVFEEKDKKRTASYQLSVDPKQKPKTMDRKLIDGGNPKSRGDVWLAIYSLDGEVLTFCSATSPRRARPTGFASTVDGLEDLCVLERVPPEKKEK